MVILQNQVIYSFLLIGTSPNAKLHIATADGTTFSASNSSWHTQVIKNDTGAASNASGLCFFTSANGYHVNAGSGIACVKNGTNSDYGADLVFITRPQSAVAVERMRIDSNGNVGIGSPPVTTLRNDIHATEKVRIGRFNKRNNIESAHFDKINALP